MRVLVTGAYGLIGSAVLSRLHRDGHELIAAGRAIAEAERRAPFARWIKADFDRLTRADAWRTLLGGLDAVVNCVGVLQDGARDDVRRVQVAATTALFSACEQSGVRRVVHISAIGAERTAPTEFARSKAEADNDLARRDLDWVILRPALVLSPAAYGGTAMLRGLAGVPFLTPLIADEARVQVVSVEDLAETVARALSPGAPGRVRYDLAHPHPHTLGALVAALRAWLGFAPARPWRVPARLGRAVAKTADALGALGWRSPARSSALAQLAEGVVGDPTAWTQATGIKPMSLDDILARHPSSVQDRWYARLYLLKPLAIAGLALFWLMTGVVTLTGGRAAGLAYLTGGGFSPGWATFTLVAGSLFDVVLGLLLLVRRLTRAVLVTMLAVTPFYLVIGTLMAPQLWLDPLGPWLKIVPVLTATLLTLAILDER